MAFAPKDVDELLVRSGRCCCLCRQFKGTKIEVHHIVRPEDGGTDDADNGIPLCFDCHADVMTYNAKHPRGRRYTASEVKRHREEWFSLLEAGHSSVRDATFAGSVPEMHLALRVAGQNGDKVILVVGREVSDPDADVYGAFLEQKDSRFDKVANPKSRAMSVFHPYHQRWATYWYGLFLYHVNMTGCPRVRFQLSNLGDAYAYGIIVRLCIPRELDLILAEDLPPAPARVPHPSEAGQSASVATMIRRSNEGEDDEDSWQSRRWSYPRPDPPQYVRRTHTLAGR